MKKITNKELSSIYNFRNGKYYYGDCTCWFKDDKFHRTNGPAKIYIKGPFAGDKEWYLDGQRMDCQTQEQFEKMIKLKAFI